MFNASLNWTSIVGLLIFFYGILTAPIAIAQIFFILRLRADTSPAIIRKSFIFLIQSAIRACSYQYVEEYYFYRDGG